MQEAQGVIQEVQGTQEAIEDAKMFTSLIKLLAKYSRDTSANERKFVVADYSANIARLLSANSSGKTRDSILESNFLFSMIVQYDCSVWLFSMFVQYVCSVCLFSMIVHNVCSVWLFTMFVQYDCSLCLFSMFVQYVCSVCLFSMIVQYVCSVCLFTCLFSMIVQYVCSVCLFSLFARSGRFLKKFFILNWEIYLYKKCYQYEEQIN